MTQPRGILYLVVGPCGAGKASLIAGAKAALQGNGAYVFPRLYVTRPVDPGKSDHIPVSEDMFETMLEREAFLLHWHADNLRYGVPKTVEEHLTHGRNVILTVSRTVVEEARSRFAPVEILYITVSDAVLEQRLHACGWASEADVQKHVARAREYLITGDDVHMIDNNGNLADSLRVFLQTIGSARVA